jgi:hypothetical protein
MAQMGHFTNSISDRIALLYVYFPMIREEVYRFVNFVTGQGGVQGRTLRSAELA